MKSSTRVFNGRDKKGDAVTITPTTVVINHKIFDCEVPVIASIDTDAGFVEFIPLTTDDDWAAGVGQFGEALARCGVTAKTGLLENVDGHPRFTATVPFSVCGIHKSAATNILIYPNATLLKIMQQRTYTNLLDQDELVSRPDYDLDVGVPKVLLGDWIISSNDGTHPLVNGYELPDLGIIRLELHLVKDNKILAIADFGIGTMRKHIHLKDGVPFDAVYGFAWAVRNGQVIVSEPIRG